MQFRMRMSAYVCAICARFCVFMPVFFCGFCDIRPYVVRAVYCCPFARMFLCASPDAFANDRPDNVRCPGPADCLHFSVCAIFLFSVFPFSMKSMANRIKNPL